MARPGRGRQHPGSAPIYFGLYRSTEGRNGQSREPAPELSEHQPGIRDWTGDCISDMAAVFSRYGTYQWNCPTHIRRASVRSHAPTILSSAAGAVASGYFALQSHD